MRRFMPDAAGERRTLADIIMEKLKDKEEGAGGEGGAGGAAAAAAAGGASTGMCRGSDRRAAGLQRSVLGDADEGWAPSTQRCMP